MGGWVSRRGSNGSTAEDKRRIRNSIEDMTHSDEAMKGILDGDLKKAVRWYHWVLYDMRFRIAYAIIFALFMGLGVPILIYNFVFETERIPNYGSCLFKDNFKFECLENVHRSPTEDQCLRAECCYDDNVTLPFKCHHSFPSAYQYEVVNLVKSLNSSINDTQSVELNLRPKYILKSQQLIQFKVKLEWINPEHLALHFYSNLSTVYPKKLTQRGHQEKKGNFNGSGYFDVTYSDSEFESFYIRIQRNDTKEIIFDTQLGPISYTPYTLSLSTVLPSVHFLGLKGIQGDGWTKYILINGPENMEFPFYLSFESSRKAHGVFLDTMYPFIAQVNNVPGIMFTLEGYQPSATLHFFVGPTPADVHRQLHAHLNENGDTDTKVGASMPPYWALGLHLCRKGYNVTETFDDLLKLNGTINATTQYSPIPYDSDCIDDNFRTPFAIDMEKYPTDSEIFNDMLDHLRSYERRILLTQKIGLNIESYGNDTENSTVPLILSREGTPFVGISKGGVKEPISIVYPDYLHSDSLKWAIEEFDSFAKNISNNTDLLSGLILIDNFPETLNSTQLCQPKSWISKIQRTFYDLGLICPDTFHNTNDVTTGEKIYHLDVHNIYGSESTRKLGIAFETSTGRSNERFLRSSVSIWPGTTSFEGFSGLKVPFTWHGLSDSLSHIIRNFMILPFTGTPICGSFLSTLTNETGPQENVDDLCLRWFQVGLLLPFARNTYERNVTLGPLDLSLKYQNYITDSILHRYRFNPYFYTRFYQSQLQPEPIIRPLVFDFHKNPTDFNSTIQILSQFMIGPGIMVAPILSEAPTREAYFPTGTWYDIHGNLIISSTSKGKTLTVPSILAEIPMYIRGGYIIPTLCDPSGSTGVETRLGNYTLLATFPTDESGTSIGNLYVDDGISRDSISNKNFDYITFEGTSKNFKINAQCNYQPTEVDISKMITEIKIYGFPNSELVIRIEGDQNFENSIQFETAAENEIKILRIYDLEIDWCIVPNVTLTWIYE